MAYQIDRYNNTTLTIVEDGTVDQTTDLKFIGKNYAGYGEIQNENFLFLLENFSGANAPPRAVSGQLWFDSANSKLKFYDGAQWRTTGGSAVGITEPTGLTDGDFWWDEANDQLYVFNGTDFILIGPQNAGEGVTQMISLELLDSTSATKSVIAATIEDEVIAIMSPHTPFDISVTTPVTGFDRVQRGITLAWTRTADSGVTNSTGVAGRDFRYWGTASNAEKLGGKLASEYITTAIGTPTVFTESVEFPDDGIAVGDSLDFKFYIANGDEGIIENQTGLGSEIKFKTTNGTGTSVNSVTVNSTGLIPGADNTYNIGTSSLRFGTIHAVTFQGTATRADSLKVGSDYRTASAGASVNTIVCRTGDGNIAANLFQGTATAARYADLAEKYTTDQEYPVGTVMAVGGEAETRAAKVSDFAVGVISENPAIMMNSEAEGQYIGLKGRVPVRVTGPVSKGMAVYAWQDGVASTITSNGLVGIALETNHDEGEKLVECVLKV